MHDEIPGGNVVVVVVVGTVVVVEVVGRVEVVVDVVVEVVVDVDVVVVEGVTCISGRKSPPLAILLLELYGNNVLPNPSLSVSTPT